MEQWLQQNPQILGSEAATGSEFDQFLAERKAGSGDAFAAEQQQASNRTTGRKLNTEQDNALFSL